jgi:hypothetical protein
MLVGAAHVHFLEGERGPEEATLRFEDAIPLLEQAGIQQLIATFHLRHPSDLRMATPGKLLEQIERYDGPLDIRLMPEANMILQRDPDAKALLVQSDIGSVQDLSVEQARLARLLHGWIVSAHFTTHFGWSKSKDHETAPEQTYDTLWPLYCRLMRQGWPGWIGHPFQYCSGPNVDFAVERLLACAAATQRVVEIPIRPVRRQANLTLAAVRERMSMFKPHLIARFRDVSHTPTPLVAVALDAHHIDDLCFGLDNAARITEWLIAEGVAPTQIWGWKP